MPRTEHFQSTADWPKIKAIWLDWKQRNRPDIKNLQDLADVAEVPYSTLVKKTPRWKREIENNLAKERAELEAKEASIGGNKAGARQGKERETGKNDQGRLNASRPSLPSDSNQYIDQYRKARNTAKDAVDIAVQGLVEEIQMGSGASRVTAIRELLDRAGLAKETEKKDEASPYETENQEGLLKRLGEVFSVYPGWKEFIQEQYNRVCQGIENEPHHLVRAPALTSITSLPSPDKNMSGMPEEAPPPVSGMSSTVLPKTLPPPLPSTPGLSKTEDGITLRENLG